MVPKPRLRVSEAPNQRHGSMETDHGETEDEDEEEASGRKTLNARKVFCFCQLLGEEGNISYSSICGGDSSPAGSSASTCASGKTRLITNMGW